MKKLVILIILGSVILGNSFAFENLRESETFPDISMISSPIQFNMDGSIFIGYDIPGLRLGSFNENQGPNNYENASIRYQIVPSIAYGFKSLNRLISKDQINELITDGKIRLTKNQKGYKSIKMLAGTLGIGPNIGLDLLPLLSIGVGIVPTKGALVYRERNVKNKREQVTLKELKIPHSREVLDQWNIGDKMSFGLTGGIHANILIGSPPVIGIGPAYQAVGNWVVKVQKISKDKVQASFTTSKLESIGLAAEATLLRLKVEKIKQAINSLGFIFDLNYDYSRRALKKFFRGDISAAQKIISENKKGIKRIRTIKSISKGNQSSKEFNLSFFFSYSREKGKTVSYSEIETDSNNDKNIFQLTQKTNQELSGGILSKHRKKFSGFFAHYKGSLEKITINSKRDDLGGTFKWLLERDKITKKKLRKQLKKLAKKTGLLKLNKIKIPKDKVNYIRASFETFINKENTLKIIDQNSRSSKFIDEIDLNFKEVLNESFNQNGHRVFCPILNKKRCKNKIKRRATRALRRMKQHVKDMQGFFLASNVKKFTEAYAKFGSLMISNPIVFKLTTKILDIKKFKIKFVGEDIPSQYLDISY